MFQINVFQFDRRRGELHLPTRSARVFASPATPYVGSQLIPPDSRPSTLTLTRYDTTISLDANRALNLNTIGQVVNITDEFGIQYHQTPYFLAWLVADVKIQTADFIVAADTQRGTVQTKYAPASRLVATWTVYPIPLF